ncbi:MAG: hypothetical protein U0Y82_05905 [Thermoleophilia bacterium]
MTIRNPRRRIARSLIACAATLAASAVTATAGPVFEEPAAFSSSWTLPAGSLPSSLAPDGTAAFRSSTSFGAFAGDQAFLQYCDTYGPATGVVGYRMLLGRWHTSQGTAVTIYENTVNGHVDQHDDGTLPYRYAMEYGPWAGPARAMPPVDCVAAQIVAHRRSTGDQLVWTAALSRVAIEDLQGPAVGDLAAAQGWITGDAVPVTCQHQRHAQGHPQRPAYRPRPAPGQPHQVAGSTDTSVPQASIRYGNVPPTRRCTSLRASSPSEGMCHVRSTSVPGWSPVVTDVLRMSTAAEIAVAHAHVPAAHDHVAARHPQVAEPEPLGPPAPHPRTRRDGQRGRHGVLRVGAAEPRERHAGALPQQVAAVRPDRPPRRLLVLLGELQQRQHLPAGPRDDHARGARQVAADAQRAPRALAAARGVGVDARGRRGVPSPSRPGEARKRATAPSRRPPGCCHGPPATTPPPRRPRRPSPARPPP